MTKIHTRTKRKYGLSTGLSHYYFFHGIKKKKRPKTFKTENSAYAWVLKHGLKPKKCYLKSVKKNKKFQIVEYGKDKNITN